MKKYMIYSFTILIVLCMSVFISSPSIEASSATTYTYTYDSKDRIVRTQDAYLPDQTLVNLDLDNPRDLFIDESDNLYIVDTGNKRVILYNTKTGNVDQEIAIPEFNSPSGIFIASDGYIYISDIGAKAVFKLNTDGELQQTFGRPTSPLYGDRNYAPSKVAVDNGGNLFIVGEGVYDGIIQLSSSGEFIGFFASNDVVLTFEQLLQNIFFTKDQLDSLTDRNPITFSNVFVGSDGLVYSTSKDVKSFRSVKKHNTAGSNMFSWTRGPSDMTDLYVDEDGIIYTATTSGLVVVYSNEGEFVHAFGAFSQTEYVAGVYEALSSIVVDSKGRIWTTDAKKNYIQSYTITQYAENIYAAINLFNNSQYEEAAVIWNDVLKLNQMSVLSHNNLGKNYLYLQEYEDAMVHFEIAGSRFYYSQAYWEVRNMWLQKNLALIFTSIVAFSVGSFVFGRLRRSEKVRNYFSDKKEKYYSSEFHKNNMNPKGTSGYQMILAYPYGIIGRGINYTIMGAKSKFVDNLLFLFTFMKKPMDSFYRLRFRRRGSFVGAVIILAVTFISYIISITSKGFIYQYVEIEDIDFNSVTIGFFSIIFLFIICNYLISSIKNGEGTLLDLFKMTMYSFGPLILSLLVTTFISHYMTFNEVFILEFITSIGWFWTLLLIFLGVQETHNYEPWDAIKSIIMTVLFMLVVAVILLIIFIMWDQVIDFFEGIFKEVWRNVQG